jgi:hypothetical protein
MKSSYVTKGGLLYRITRDAERRILMQWARTGGAPSLRDVRGVTEIGVLRSFDGWDLQNVEEALLDWLREGRQAPAGEEEAVHGAALPPASEPAGHYRVGPTFSDPNLVEIVDTETGQVVASGLTPKQADKKIADLTWVEA